MKMFIERPILAIIVVGILFYISVALKYYDYSGRGETSHFMVALHNPSARHNKTALTRKNRMVKKKKKPLLIFVGIVSAPVHVTRRNALRTTWLKYCHQNKKAACWIFTDKRDVNSNILPARILTPLLQEQELHRDVIFTDTPGGINFARRYLWILNWANARYTFDYLLRLDDDYFVCFDRLLLELPQREKHKMYWGHVHCRPKGGIRVDEGFVIVSNDLVQIFLEEENRSLMCHPYGDQAMIMWINSISDVIYFGDPRVHHDVSSGNAELLNKQGICDHYLALHGSYPDEIRVFWENELKRSSSNYSIPPVTYPCGQDSKLFNKNNFEANYYADPVPCKNKPSWNLAPFYAGRMPGN